MNIIPYPIEQQIQTYLPINLIKLKLSEGKGNLNEYTENQQPMNVKDIFLNNFDRWPSSVHQ